MFADHDYWRWWWWSLSSVDPKRGCVRVCVSACVCVSVFLFACWYYFLLAHSPPTRGESDLLRSPTRPFFCAMIGRSAPRTPTRSDPPARTLQRAKVLPIFVPIICEIARTFFSSLSIRGHVEASRVAQLAASVPWPSATLAYSAFLLLLEGKSSNCGASRPAGQSFPRACERWWGNEIITIDWSVAMPYRFPHWRFTFVSRTKRAELDFLYCCSGLFGCLSSNACVWYIPPTWCGCKMCHFYDHPSSINYKSRVWLPPCWSWCHTATKQIG